MTKSGEVQFLDPPKGFDPEEVEKIDVENLKLNLSGKKRMMGPGATASSGLRNKANRTRLSFAAGGEDRDQPRLPLEILKQSSSHIFGTAMRSIINFLEGKMSRMEQAEALARAKQVQDTKTKNERQDQEGKPSKLGAGDTNARKVAERARILTAQKQLQKAREFQDLTAKMLKELKGNKITNLACRKLFVY